MGTVLALTLFVFGLSWWLTRYLCSPDSKFLLLDHPNERSLHARPIPRTGGLAIVASTALGMIGVVLFSESKIAWIVGNQVDAVTFWPWWILGPTLVLAVVSFWDDRMGLAPSLRLAIHFGAALAATWGYGLAIPSLRIPLLGEWSLGWAAYPFVLLFIVWVTNLYNFMDGMDGLAGGMAVVGFGVLSLLAWQAGRYQYASILLLIAAASGGYLMFNLPPARIFMGDAGSVPLGFLAGTLTMVGVRERIFDLWTPLLVFSPFIVDASVTLFWRLLRGEKVWLAHREHYYQRLVLYGLGHRETLFFEMVLMIASAVGAVAYAGAGEQIQLTLLGLWVFVYFGLAASVHALEQRNLRRRA